jgi:hypothetical protein
MKKIIYSDIVVCILLLGSLIPQGYSAPASTSFEGFWIYGFEQSLLETCDGESYWMWTPDEFKGKYKLEGYRNPVIVIGYLLPSNPEKNMSSSLFELNIVDIKHANKPC